MRETVKTIYQRLVILGVLLTAIFALIRLKPRDLQDNPEWRAAQQRLAESQARLDLVEGQLRKARGEIASLQTQPSPARAAEPVPAAPVAAPPPVAAGDWTRLTARLEDFESRLQRAESFDNSVVDGFNLLARRGLIPPTEETLAQLTGILSETNAPPEDKLDALKVLGRFKAITPEMVPLLAEWWQSDTNKGVREQIFKQLKGTQSEEMKPLLLQGVLADQPRGVREAAVENLVAYADDPQVARLLATIATDDPDEKIRREAQKLLFGKDASAKAPAKTKDKSKPAKKAAK